MDQDSPWSNCSHSPHPHSNFNLTPTPNIVLTHCLTMRTKTTCGQEASWQAPFSRELMMVSVLLRPYHKLSKLFAAIWRADNFFRNYFLGSCEWLIQVNAHEINAFDFFLLLRKEQKNSLTYMYPWFWEVFWFFKQIPGSENSFWAVFFQGYAITSRQLVALYNRVIVKISAWQVRTDLAFRWKRELYQTHLSRCVCVSVRKLFAVFYSNN